MSTSTPINGTGTDLGRALRTRWWLVVLLALLGGAAGVGGTTLVPQQYSATVTIVVQLPNSSADTEALVRTVEALTTSTIVLGDVATNSGTGLSTGDVRNRLQVERPPGSAVIEAAVIDTVRPRARAVAEQIVPVLQQRILESRGSAESTASKIAVESFGGGPEVEVVDPPVLRAGGIGAVAGAAIGLLFAVALAGRAARRSLAREHRGESEKPTRRAVRRQRKQHERAAKADESGGPSVEGSDQGPVEGRAVAHADDGRGTGLSGQPED